LAQGNIGAERDCSVPNYLWLANAREPFHFYSPSHGTISGQASLTKASKSARLKVPTYYTGLISGAPANELRAAIAILEHAQKGVELLDFEERLSALEQRLGPDNATP